MRIELVVDEDEVDRFVELIQEACYTGQPGDGVIWVTPVDAFRRIRLKG